MKKYCANCGAIQKKRTLYCWKCGHKLGLKVREMDQDQTSFLVEDIDDALDIPSIIDPNPNLNLRGINEEINLTNRSQGPLKWMAYVSILFFVVFVLTFFEWSPINGSFVISFVSGYLLFISLLMVFYVFKQAKKTKANLSHDDLLAEWTLNQHQLEKYAKHIFNQYWKKIKIALLFVFVISLLFFGVAMFLFEESDYSLMAYFPAVFLLIIFVAYFDAISKKRKELSGDGLILLAPNYAYVNGRYLDWKHSPTVKSKFRVIKKPFYGLGIRYLLKEGKKESRKQFEIPANEDMDLILLIRKLKNKNKN